jgi:hypothetical protein
MSATSRQILPTVRLSKGSFNHFDYPEYQKAQPSYGGNQTNTDGSIGQIRSNREPPLPILGSLHVGQPRPYSVCSKPAPASNMQTRASNMQNCQAIYRQNRPATSRRTRRRINLTSRSCRRQKMPSPASSHGLYCNKDTAKTLSDLATNPFSPPQSQCRSRTAGACWGT